MAILREISPLTLQPFYRRFLPFYRSVCVCVCMFVCVETVGVCVCVGVY